MSGSRIQIMEEKLMKIEALKKEAETLYESLKAEKVQYLKQLFNDLSEKEIGELYACSKVYNQPLTSCVYFIQNEYTGLIKIGQTSDLIERIKQLKACFTLLGMAQSKLRLIGLIATFPQYSGKYEKVIHEVFADKRIIGEWFDISEDDVYREIFFDASDNFAIISGVPIDYGEFEFGFYKSIPKDYELNYADFGLRSVEINDWFGYLNVISPRTNKLSDLINFIHKNKVGFCSFRFENDGLHRVGISYDKQDPISFSDIKKHKFDASYWRNIIKQINT